MIPEITTGVPGLLLWAAIGYLIGSIPFGLLVTKAMGMGDVRDIGSGNIGATNVLRTGSKSAAALTLLLDGGKGILVVLLARAFAADDAVQLAALCAFLGHCLPVWLGFKGGKGVATYIGVLIGLFWPAAIVFGFVWLAMAWIFRYSSLSALTAAIVVPVAAVVGADAETTVLFILLSLLLIARHHANIRRLVTGQEPKIGAKS